MTVETAINNQYGGSDEAGTTRWFNGVMDEVRVSSVIRSADLVWASWKNVNSNETFATYGPVQDVGPRYTFSATAGIGGNVTGSSSGTYVPGRSVTVSAVAGPYYHSSNWTGDVPAIQASQSPLTLVMDQNRSITANFAPDLAVQGVPHWWLAQYGWMTNFDAAALGDADGDGQPTWQEYYAGTVPTNAVSVFTSRLVYLATTSQLQLTWSSVAGKWYRTERATSLQGPWTIRTTNIAATPPMNTLTFPRPAFSGAFYRVVVE